MIHPTRRGPVVHPFLRNQFFLLSLSLVMFAACSPAFAEQKVNSNPCAIPEILAAGLQGSDSDSIHAVRDFQDAVMRLLQRSRFKELDCVADRARSSQEKFSGGMWKLHIFYTGLVESNHHDTENDWQARLGHLNDWVSANPRSITARVALAWAYANYAWDARGDGYAQTVSKNGWKLFEQRMAKSRRILQEAESLRSQCPEWYASMEEVALAQGWSRDEEQALFERGVKFAPSYYYIYRQHAYYLLPKWHGEEGESAKFAEAAADRIGGEKGDILYFQIAGLLCFHNNDEWAKPVSLMSWPRIRRGFEALEKQGGKSYKNLNLLALIATLREDFVVADSAFARIGDQVDDSTWRSKTYFENCKEDAKMNAPIQAEIHSREASADANLATPEGAQYQTLFDARIKELMQPCTEPTEGKPIQVEVLIRVAKDGKIENMVGVGVTNASNCLMKQLAEFRLKDQSVFPPPPKPSYWMKKNIDPVTSAPVAKN